LIRARVDNATKDSGRISLGSQAGTTGSTGKETCTIPYHTSSPLSFPSTASRLIASGPTWTRGLPGRVEDIQARSSIQASMIYVSDTLILSQRTSRANPIWLRTWRIRYLPDHHVRLDSSRPEPPYRCNSSMRGPFRSNSQDTKSAHGRTPSSHSTTHSLRRAVVIASDDWTPLEAMQKLYNQSTLRITGSAVHHPCSEHIASG
jgi:hypothetical protein